jgi:hypothetical protein
MPCYGQPGNKNSLGNQNRIGYPWNRTNGRPSPPYGIAFPFLVVPLWGAALVRVKQDVFFG